MRRPTRRSWGALLPLAVVVFFAPPPPAIAATFVPLGDLPGGLFDSRAFGVSADGATVVGSSVGASGVEAFRWSGGVMTGLGGLLGVFSRLSHARGVSADGATIVGDSFSAPSVEAFRWIGGAMTGLGDLPGGDFFSTALGVSADGATVVGESRSASGPEAVVWDSVNGMRSLKQVLTGLGVDLTDWTLTSADGISADGRTIVGVGTNPSGQTEAWLAIIPEPGTGLLVMTGLLGLVGWRRRHGE